MWPVTGYLVYVVHPLEECRPITIGADQKTTTSMYTEDAGNGVIGENWPRKDKYTRMEMS